MDWMDDREFNSTFSYNYSNIIEPNFYSQTYHEDKNKSIEYGSLNELDEPTLMDLGPEAYHDEINREANTVQEDGDLLILNEPSLAKQNLNQHSTSSIQPQLNLKKRKYKKTLLSPENIFKSPLDPTIKRILDGEIPRFTIEDMKTLVNVADSVQKTYCEFEKTYKKDFQSLQSDTTKKMAEIKHENSINISDLKEYIHQLLKEVMAKITDGSMKRDYDKLVRKIRKLEEMYKLQDQRSEEQNRKFRQSIQYLKSKLESKKLPAHQTYSRKNRKKYSHMLKETISYPNANEFLSESEWYE